eukprot:c54565_g1_i1 orf=106-282(+)
MREMPFYTTFLEHPNIHCNAQPKCTLITCMKMGINDPNNYQWFTRKGSIMLNKIKSIV